MFQADGESGGLLDSADAFSDKVIRLGFMRKVYSILSLQLLLTTAVSGLFYIEPIRAYTQGNGHWLIWVAFIPRLVILFVFNTWFEIYIWKYEVNFSIIFSRGIN